MKDYQLLHEDDNQFQVSHPDGTHFKVAKKGLSKKMHEQIRGYAGGGEIDPNFTVMDGGDQIVDRAPASMRDTSMDAPPDLNISAPSPQFGGYEPTANAIGFQPAPGPIQLPPPEHAQVVAKAEEPNLVGKDGTLQIPGQPQQTQAAGKAPPSEVDKLQALGQAGINHLQKAAQDKAEADEVLYNQHLADLKALAERTDQQLADNEHEADQLKANIQNGKIDPTRLWKNTSTGNQAMATIGLILGGMGGRGQGNQALDMLNKAIDRDIDAQKEDVNNNKTLLSYNMKKYGDIRMAEAATRIQLGSTLQAQLSATSARTNNLAAQGQAEMAKLALGQSMLPLKASLAKQQMEAKSFGGGLALNGAEDQALMRADPKYSAQRIAVDGRVYRHTGDVKAANEQRVFESKMGPIESAVRQLDRLGPSAAIPGSKDWNAAIAIRQRLGTSIAGLMSTEIGSTRINSEEVHAALEQLHDNTKFSQMLNGGIRNQIFLKDLHETADSLRSQNLIGYKGAHTVPGVQSGWKL